MSARDGSSKPIRKGYWESHNRYFAARRENVKLLMASPAAVLLERLSREPLSLRDRVGLAVHWGLSMQLVRYDEGTRIAYAAQSFEQVDSAVLNEWLQGDAYEEAQGKGDEDPHAGLTHATSSVQGSETDLESSGSESGAADVDPEAAYEEHGEALFATYEEMRAFKDLRYALTTGYGQSVALRALGIAIPAERESLIRIPDSSIVDIANQLLPGVALIAEERVPEDLGIVPKTRRVPQKVWDEFVPIAVQAIQNIEGIKQPLWILQLKYHFEHALHGGARQRLLAEERTTAGIRRTYTTERESNPDLAAAAAVDDVLDTISECPDAPKVFLRRAKEHVELAKQLLRRIRIETTDPDGDDAWPEFHFEPDRVQRGRPVKPMKAASMFARCFGVVIPSRERDARRRK